LETNGHDRGARRRPIRGGSIGELQPAITTRDPAFDCCCGDHCPGDVGGPHCNASTAYRLGDFDTTEHGHLYRDGLHNDPDATGNGNDQHASGDDWADRDRDCDECAYSPTARTRHRASHGDR
jgi:hypothetical protein